MVAPRVWLGLGLGSALGLGFVMMTWPLASAGGLQAEPQGEDFVAPDLRGVMPDLPQAVTRMRLGMRVTGQLTRQQRRAVDIAAAAAAQAARVVAGASFVSYRSSWLEQLWLANVTEWQTDSCEHLRRGDAQVWIHTVAQAMASRASTAVMHFSRTAQVPEAVIRSPLSCFTYQLASPTAGGARYVHVLIEPTAGIVKDPRKCWAPHSVKYSQGKEYLLPLSLDAAHASGVFARHAPPPDGVAPMALLFDAGATIPTSAGAPRDAGWTGTSWIFDWYAARGVVFDKVFAWEPATRGRVNMSAALAQLDPAMAKALHYFQRGVSSQPGHPDNPLALIASLCRPCDLCVFKLDIDTIALEMSLASQLLYADAELRDLVDEFFWEQHFVRDSPTSNNMDAWYSMATHARHRGLRMHYWP